MYHGVQLSKVSAKYYSLRDSSLQKPKRCLQRLLNEARMNVKATSCYL